eukprot:5631033-Pyramimonas_sp.AAC.1
MAPDAHVRIKLNLIRTCASTMHGFDGLQGPKAAPRGLDPEPSRFQKSHRQLSGCALQGSLLSTSGTAMEGYRMDRAGKGRGQGGQ